MCKENPHIHLGSKCPLWNVSGLATGITLPINQRDKRWFEHNLKAQHENMRLWVKHGYFWTQTELVIVYCLFTYIKRTNKPFTLLLQLHTQLYPAHPHDLRARPEMHWLLLWVPVHVPVKAQHDAAAGQPMRSCFPRRFAGKLYKERGPTSWS